MNFLSNLRYKMQSFMYGRNGFDLLSRDLWILSMILMIIGSIPHLLIFNILGLIIFFISVFRVVSRNCVRRSAENTAYYNFRSRFLNWFAVKQQNIASSKYYRFYKCTNCRQKLRVPKGRGKIEINCPKCGNKFVKKT